MTELLQALRQMEDPSLELVVFDTNAPVYQGTNRWLKLLEHARLHWWKQVSLPWKAWRSRCNVLFTTDYFVPYWKPGFKTITVFHDAFFFETPGHYSPLFLWFFHRVAVPAAKRCASIVVPSEYVKERLRHFLQLPSSRLVTIYEAPKSLNRELLPPAQEERLLQQWQLTAGGYLLHVGMLNKRKNIPFLIEAFARVARVAPSVKLVLAGSFHTTPHINDEAAIRSVVTRHQLEHRVVFTGYVSDGELAGLYKNARLYIFPSLNEGFGLPVLEAFLQGVPVLVADNSCLPEIGGDAVMVFDPYDAKGLANKIIKLLSEPETCSRMQAAGFRRLSFFSWQKAAAQIVALCRGIV